MPENSANDIRQQWLAMPVAVLDHEARRFAENPGEYVVEVRSAIQQALSERRAELEEWRRTEPCHICTGPAYPARDKLLYGKLACEKCRTRLFRRRCAAFLADALLTGILANIIIAFFRTPNAWTQLLIVWLLADALFLFRDSFGVTSPGKLMFGLRTVDAATGRPSDFTQGIMRNLPLLVPFAPVFAYIGLADGQRIGDGWARTRVITKA